MLGRCIRVSGILMVFAWAVWAQTVPHFVKLSGALKDRNHQPLTGTVGLTFEIYQEQEGGPALWVETQNGELDDQGHYAVLLGATRKEGLPPELFAAGEGRWLKVRVQGQEDQPRMPLVSVPYALKAVDAEKLAGRSASEFVLAEVLPEAVRREVEAQLEARRGAASGTRTEAAMAASANQPANILPATSFVDTTSDQVVGIQQLGTGRGLAASALSNAAVQGSSGTGPGVVGNAGASGKRPDTIGVLGTSAGAAGIGVLGEASDPGSSSGSTIGVQGLSGSAGGTGVAGKALAPSGGTVGLHGVVASDGGTAALLEGPAAARLLAARAGGVEVFRVNGSSSGPESIVQANNPNTSGNAIGLTGGTASTSGIGVVGRAGATTGAATGVLGFSASPSGVGVVGAAGATTGPATGVRGHSDSPAGAGVQGICGPGADRCIGVFGDSPGEGVTGRATGGGTVAEGIGVIGFATPTSGDFFGVGGETNSPGGGGVFGQSASTGGIGVAGVAQAPGGLLDGAAGMFVSIAGAKALQGFASPTWDPFMPTPIFTVDSAGNLSIAGNFTAGGTKSAVVPVSGGRKVALYAVESPENWFEDFGAGQLQAGTARIDLDPLFIETVNTDAAYHVFLTPNGDCQGLYVELKTARGFQVRELGNGSSAVKFDYRVVARRKGYETVRLQEVPGPASALLPGGELPALLRRAGALPAAKR